MMWLEYMSYDWMCNVIRAPPTPPAPSGPPQNLTSVFINSTSLHITLAPPLPSDHNGVIRGYNVSYNMSAGEEESIFVHDTTVELTGLEKFTYNVSVQAFTVRSGPIGFTAIRTDSDGEFTNIKEGGEERR